MAGDTTPVDGSSSSDDDLPAGGTAEARPSVVRSSTHRWIPIPLRPRTQ